MNAAIGQTPENDFYNSQLLAPQERSITFEALFFRQLQQVTNKIHETDNVDQIMLDVSHDICKLFNADRLTLYAVNGERSAIVSKVKTGLNSIQDLKLPIGAQSIAGYVAMSGQLLNIADVYDIAALKKIHPSLNFLQAVDKRSGYRSKQMLVVPVMDGGTLYGVCRLSTTAATSRLTSLMKTVPCSCAKRWVSPSASACKNWLM